MHTVSHLGASPAGFMCSGTTCQGTNQATQRAFIALQTEINRVGRNYGVSRIDTDGKLGPATLRAAITLAERVTTKLGTAADGALSDLLIEIDDRNATTVRDLAERAEVITAALQRDGMAQAQRSIYTAARNQMQQIIDAGAGALAPYTPTLPGNVPTPGGGGNSSTPTGYEPGAPWPPAAGGAAVVPSVSTSIINWRATWKVWAGVGAAALAVIGAGLWYGRRQRRSAARPSA